MDDATALLITVTGRDRPGLTSALCSALDAVGVRLLDVEQVTLRDRLVLGILVSLGDDESPTCEVLTADAERLCVTVMGQPLRARALASVTARIAECGGNIERIVRLSRYPIMSFELLVSGGDPERLRAEVSVAAAANHVDVAVQRADLYRRAKRLIVMDVDSTLIQGEVIELLAAHAGCGDRVKDITERAMAGEIDFEQSLRERVALLQGLPVSAIDHVRQHLTLTPGARTLVRTLKRLGFAVAIVSGGFTQITDELKDLLHLDYAAANTLEVVDGVITGRLLGEVIDRAGKVEALERFAAASDVPISQTVAVGDGANDIDMLTRAGLGIAFNAKPIVRQAADTAVTVPYLDAILFLLGITREEIEAADAADGTATLP